MPRKRNKSNQGLPARWRFRFDAYYYRVPPGLEHLWDNRKEFFLGTKLAEAYKTWAARLDAVAPTNDISTIGQLLDRYALEVIPTKSPKSRANNANQLPWLKKVFQNQPLLPFKPQLVYKYVSARSIKRVNPNTGRVTGGKIAAHREIELLSHAYTKAVEWGIIDHHPFKKEVILEGEPPKTRYVEDWEIVEALSLVPRRKRGSVLMIQAYLRLKLLTGMAQGDLLRLTDDDLKPEGILIERHKTAGSSGKRTLYEWTDQLEDAVEMAFEARHSDKPGHLFCNRYGEGYVNEEAGTQSGWKSMWQRFIQRVIAETKVKEPFTEHDLRAKVGSDAMTLEHARALLSHADSRTTQRVYRRRPEHVKPLDRGDLK